MLDRLERGDAKALLTWDIDRLYRNPIDEGAFVGFATRDHHLKFGHRFEDFSPKIPVCFLGVEGGRASDHLMKMIYNLKRTTDDKLRNGKYPASRSPFGYMFNKTFGISFPIRRTPRL